jgi:hypothetical protein
MVERAGMLVRVKVCEACGREGRVTSDRSSDFPLNGRWPDGCVRGWKPICKPCYAAKQKAIRERDIERYRAADRQAYRLLAKDPEWMITRRVYAREYRRHRRIIDPAFKASERERHRRWRAKKLREDPDYFTSARRLERYKHRADPPPVGPVGPQRVDNRPLRRAVEVYLEASSDGWDPLAREIFPTMGAMAALRLQRALGVRDYWLKGERRRQQRISYDVAVRIVRALRLPPVEVGV